MFLGTLGLLEGRHILAELIRWPTKPSTQGSTNVHSITLKIVTNRPAIPIERNSLIGTVRSAENPIATVVAEIAKVHPACHAARSAAQPGSYPSHNASRKRLTISKA